MVLRCVINGDNAPILATLAASVSILSLLFLTPVQAPAHNDKTAVTEFLDDDRYAQLSSEPPYAIDVIGHWEVGAHQKLAVKVAPSDIDNFQEMKSIVKGLASGTHKSATEFTGEYERWNELLSSTIDGAKVPMLSFKANRPAHDILVQLTDEPHPNGRSKAVTMVYQDGERITAAEITIYGADQLYSDGEFAAVMQHELGHALGLGHSNYAGSIMYPALIIVQDEIIGSISECETQGVRSAYSSANDKAECDVE